MPGNGKIARLPFAIRTQLNHRLENGEQAKALVAWLNSVWVVRQVLEEEFDGRPISEQNLSGWRQREHQEWLKRRETRSSLRQFLDEAEELEEQVGEVALTNRLAARLALTLAQLLQSELRAEDKGASHRRALLEIARELARLREGDHEMHRAELQRERWEVERERAAEEDRRREIAEHKADLRGRVFAALTRPILVKAFGGGEIGEKAAELFDYIERGIPLPEANDNPRVCSDPTKSKSIKANQGENLARPATAGSISHSIRRDSTESNS